MIHSDIFDEYVKTMEEKGLITKTAESMEREEKYKNKEYLANIEGLYGIKIDTNDSDKDLIDQAHPDYVIPTMSYDKVNSLIENIWQRNDIMKGLVNKPVTGGEFRHIYAQSLLDDLIKIGYDAENENNDEIRALADSCSERLVKGFEKEAQWAALLKWSPKIILGLASIVGFDLIKDRTAGLVSNGIVPDIDRALENLTKLHELAYPDGKQEASKWIAALSGYKKLTGRALEIMSRPSTHPEDVNSPEGINWALEHANNIEGNQEEIKYVHDYIKASKNLLTHIPAAVERIKSIQVQKEHSSWGEWVDNIKSLWHAATGDVATDSALSLEALGTSISNTIKVYVETIPEAKAKAEEHKESLSDTLSNFTSSLSNAVSGKPQATDEKASEKVKSILGL
jgi:hypothetical protein